MPTEVDVLELWDADLPAFDGDKAAAKMYVIAGEGLDGVQRIAWDQIEQAHENPQSGGFAGLAIRRKRTSGLHKRRYCRIRWRHERRQRRIHLLGSRFRADMENDHGHRLSCVTSPIGELL
jgi:hypothetical protein